MENTDKDFKNLSNLRVEDFKTKMNGKESTLFLLHNDLGMEVAVTNYGCTLLSIMVPDKNNQYNNVILGHSSMEDILHCPEPFLNTAVGRYANRIAKGHFTLNGKEFKLAINNGPNALHGGPTGFHARIWDAEQIDQRTLKLSYLSKDGEEGYPGNLTTEIIYQLDNTKNALIIKYKATTDQSTVVNLTNHAFFNLAGIANPTPTIEDNIVTINAKFFTPMDNVSIPTGEIKSVKDTPMDFTTAKVVGKEINADYDQTKFGAGYDHCYVLNKKEANLLTEAATCYDPKSGRMLTVKTTEPGVQFYTGNWLGGFKGAHGATFPARSALCFEAQRFPDTPNRPYFPTAVLNPGEEYKQTTVYEFSIK